MKNGECIVTKDEWTPRIKDYINLIEDYIYYEVY